MRDFREKRLQISVRFLKEGKIVVFPTDTQWAIACDAFNEAAVEKIYLFKKRPREKALIWMASHFETMSPYFEDSRELKSLMLKYWPGPLTLLFKRKNSESLQGARIPNNKTALAILNKYQGILSTSSANISGGHPVREISDLMKTFQSPDIYIIPNLFAEEASFTASTIVGINPLGEIVVYRQGDVQI